MRRKEKTPPTEAARRTDYQEVEGMNIGENIRRIRVERGMTQAELANAVGVTQAMICSVERGTKACAMQLGAEIARALDCPVMALYGEKTQAPA